MFDQAPHSSHENANNIPSLSEVGGELIDQAEMTPELSRLLRSSIRDFNLRRLMEISSRINTCPSDTEDPVIEQPIKDCVELEHIAIKTLLDSGQADKEVKDK